MIHYNQVLLNGKPAYKLNAVRVAETPQAGRYKLDGFTTWIPKSVSKFTRSTEPQESDDEVGAILILDWFYNKNIKNAQDNSEF